MGLKPDLHALALAANLFVDLSQIPYKFTLRFFISLPPYLWGAIVR